MFKRIPRRCSWWGTHSPHETPTGFFDTAFCDGVENINHAPLSWLSYDDRRMKGHKHTYRLTKILVTPKGVRLYPESLGWVCDCGFNYVVRREQYWR